MASDVAMVEEVLEKGCLQRDDLVRLLAAGEEESRAIFRRAAAVKKGCVGNKAYFRGLIEYSNRCVKNCLYCGIRSGNANFTRYEMTEAETLHAARFAWESRYASIVLQAGERTDEAFAAKIEDLIRKIQEETRGELHITLSLGEQSPETYERWRRAGAHRYLLRIEVSNPALYGRLHPGDGRHSHAERLRALGDLRRLGYQVGTGVMIGLPFQTVEDLADDLLFFRDYDIDMVGMGPYIEHPDTPLYRHRGDIPPLGERFQLSLRMVALLRIMMKDINIAATTAMQAIDPMGREKALRAGANVLMPNLTPVKYRSDYLLYENKPCIHEEAEACKFCLESRILSVGDVIAYGEWGDSRHYAERNGVGAN
ncbi:MAG: [FeFe] hydrogenase H-cluster radical SAM maturase HydE [Acidobacteriota bacterium]|nr:[FeFe] hydrogenase H-cluster radical SAM maturase HydE [Acidobacteriota bacterium]